MNDKKKEWYNKFIEIGGIITKVPITGFVSGGKAIWVFVKEFFYIRTEKKGKTIFKPSSTKVISLIFTILLFVIYDIVLTAFWMKLYGSNEQKEALTSEILNTFLGLAGIATILTSFLRFLYSYQKKSDMKNIEDHAEIEYEE